MTALRLEKSVIIEKLNAVFTGVIHLGGTEFIQQKRRENDKINQFKIIKDCDPECIVWMPDKKTDCYFW